MSFQVYAYLFQNYLMYPWPKIAPKLYKGCPLINFCFVPLNIHDHSNHKANLYLLFHNIPQQYIPDGTNEIYFTQIKNIRCWICSIGLPSAVEEEKQLMFQVSESSLTRFTQLKNMILKINRPIIQNSKTNSYTLESKTLQVLEIWNDAGNTRQVRQHIGREE